MDGEIHLQKENMEYDRMRTSAFNHYGIHVIRFTNKEILQNSSNVLSAIEKSVDKLIKSSPNP